MSDSLDTRIVLSKEGPRRLRTQMKNELITILRYLKNSGTYVHDFLVPVLSFGKDSKSAFRMILLHPVFELWIKMQIGHLCVLCSQPTGTRIIYVYQELIYQKYIKNYISRFYATRQVQFIMYRPMTCLFPPLSLFRYSMVS